MLDYAAGYAPPGSIANYSHIRVIRADEQLISPTTSARGQAAGYSGDSMAIAFGLNRALWGGEFCFKHDAFCINTDGLCIEMMGYVLVGDGSDLFKEVARMEEALKPYVHKHRVHNFNTFRMKLSLTDCSRLQVWGTAALGEAHDAEGRCD